MISLLPVLARRQAKEIRNLRFWKHDALVVVVDLGHLGYHFPLQLSYH